MTGRRNFADLKSKMSPERQARIAARTQELIEEMDLAQIRTALHLSQAALAEVLAVEQPAIAKIEKRADMYVSTLRRFIEAMGGELELVARFPDHSIRIKSFQELGTLPRRSRAAMD